MKITVTLFPIWLLAMLVPVSAGEPVVKNADGPTAPLPVADLPQEANAPALSPGESLTKFHVADDLVWEQVLAEPQITQPAFLNFDARGRMWVVEYRQYLSPAGLKMISHDSVWRSVYDRVPPPPHHFKGKCSTCPQVLTPNF